MADFDRLHEGSVSRFREGASGPLVEDPAATVCRRRAIVVGDSQNLIDFDHLHDGSLTDRYWG